ncbi:MAG: DUF503 domain-containing protein [Actinomycetota bacterium]
MGTARFDFLVPGSQSLKDKRQVIRHIVATIGNKFNMSVAEVDYQDLRQRGALGVACVSNSSFHAKKMLHEIERFMRDQYSIEVIDVDIEVMTPDA